MRVLHVVCLLTVVMAVTEPVLGRERYCRWDEDTTADEWRKAPGLFELLAGARPPVSDKVHAYYVAEYLRQNGGRGVHDPRFIESCRALNRLDVAEQAAWRWLEQSPQVADAWVALGRVRLSQRRYADAERELLRGLRLAVAAAADSTFGAGQERSLTDSTWLQWWLEARLARYWHAVATNGDEARNFNCLHVDFDYRLGSDWREREDAVRTASNPVFGATPSPRFFENARYLAAQDLGRRWAEDAGLPVEAHAGLRISPLRLRMELARLLAHQGETPLVAPWVEILGECCALAGDGHLAFRAYRLATRLYVARRQTTADAEQWPRDEWHRALTGDVAGLVQKLAERDGPQAKPIPELKRAMWCVLFADQVRGASRDPNKAWSFSDAAIQAERGNGARIRALELSRQDAEVASGRDPFCDVAMAGDAQHDVLLVSPTAFVLIAFTVPALFAVAVSLSWVWRGMAA